MAEFEPTADADAPNIHPLLGSPHRLKLALFGLNVSGGCSMTSAPGTLAISWPESVRIAQLAESVGLDAIIPVARWKGMGGDTNFNHRSFEPFTWAAGLASVTQHIGLFATCHVPTAHPVRVAKEFATVDQISGGRFGLNIVAGWNAAEMAMFGLDMAEHDTRYEMADEWIRFIQQLWRAAEPFDFNGEFFHAPGAYSNPQPVQAEPLIMSAGNSPRGQSFAAAQAQLNFVVAPDLATAGATANSVKQQARALDRQLQVFGQVYIVCRETKAEAQAYVDQYVNELGDWSGVRNLLDILIPNSQSALGEQWEAMAANMIAGYGALPLVGTADDVTAGLIELSEAGLDGTTLSWVNYEEGLMQYKTELLPRLIEAGLRESI